MRTFMKSIAFSACALVMATGVRADPVTTRVSAPLSAGQSDGHSALPAFSADGSTVAFVSTARTLLPSSPTNGAQHVYVASRMGGVLERVSVNSTGGDGNASSYMPSLSDDGNFVAFASDASNLVSGDTNIARDVFVVNRVSREIERVSVSASGQQGNGASATPALSATGRYVAYFSRASNIVSEDTNNKLDVFVYDRSLRVSERVSVNSQGVEGNGDSGIYRLAISPDGRFVAFSSDATNLVSGDTNSRRDIFLRDRELRTTTRISVSTGGDQGNGNSEAPSLSANTRYIAFRSAASNLAPASSLGFRQIYVRDRISNTTERVSVSSTGDAGSGDAFDEALSADGRYVIFQSFGSNLVENDTNNAPDIFLHDRYYKTTVRVSVSSAGVQSNGPSTNVSLSNDGQWVTFDSGASNLVEGDTNLFDDIFVRGPLLVPPLYTVSGKIELDTVTDPAQSITFTFRPQSTMPQFSYTYTLQPDGSFSLPNIPENRYTIHIKGSKWLAKNIGPIEVRGDRSDLNVFLHGGDADGSNAVDVLDLDLFIRSFDLMIGDPKFISGADFSCDGSVDVTDLDIFIRNFDRMGEE